MRRWCAFCLAAAACALGGLLAAAESAAPALAHYRHTAWKVEQGLPHNHVQTLAQTLDGYLWLGTPLGLVRFDGFSFPTFRVPAQRSNNVQTLLADREGSLWIGAEAGGVARLRDGRFASFGPAEGLEAGLVRAIVQSEDGTIWIVVADRGLFRFDGRRFSRGPALPEAHIASIAAGASDLAVGTDDAGLIRVAADRVTQDDIRDGFPLTGVRALRFDQSGTLWAAGPQGVARLRERWTGADAGLATIAATVLCEDSAGGMWIGTEADGVYRQTDRTTEHFGAAEGLSANQVDAIVEDWEGNIWIGTPAGLDRLTPARAVAARRRDPPVRIEQVLVDGRPAQMPEENDEVRLSPGVANLEIRYTALNLTSPEAVKFRYRLEGYDSNWIERDNRRTAYYMNLRSGHYRFVIAATTTPGVWGPPVGALAIYLPPYFYQTYGFYSACGGAVILVAVGVYWVRARRLRALADRLQALVDERTAMLERTNQELQRLTTIDGLTGVANRRRFDDALETEWRRARRASTPLACIMIDIDNFKAFNDLYGHLRGDECQKQIAAALATGANRAGDLVARYGGEEFALILPETGVDGARAVAEMLRARVASLKIPHGRSNTAGVVTISAGVACLVPGRDDPPETLIVAADRALYRAKHAGKNRVESGG